MNSKIHGKALACKWLQWSLLSNNHKRAFSCICHFKNCTGARIVEVIMGEIKKKVLEYTGILYRFRIVYFNHGASWTQAVGLVVTEEMFLILSQGTLDHHGRPVPQFSRPEQQCMLFSSLLAASVQQSRVKSSYVFPPLCDCEELLLEYFGLRLPLCLVLSRMWNKQARHHHATFPNLKLSSQHQWSINNAYTFTLKPKCCPS